MKLNKWALAVANATAVFYTAAAAALYIWGERAMCYVEKIHFIKLSNEMVDIQISPASYGWGLVSHYVVSYIFVALVIYFHDHIKKGK